MATQQRATRTRKSRIRFPVIEEFHVDDYPLYPGANGNGLRAVLSAPLTVIAGINGIGKTTFLNILLRVLVGPFDPLRGDKSEPGGRLHELVATRRFNYFAARIGGDARPASATLKLRFGDNVVTVRRSLGPDLKILELLSNNTILEHPDEDRYTALISEVSGASDRYDFDFVIRNLIFFMEEKVPLIWNPKGQFEILRILFLEPDLAAACSRLYDEIFTLDSKYRNLLWPFNAANERLEELLQTQQEISPELKDLPVHEALLTAGRQELETDENLWQQLIGKLSEADSQIFSLDIELQGHLNRVSALEQVYFSKAFPGIQDVTQVTLGSLLDTDHCLACGNDSSRGKKRLLALLDHHQCPICESEINAAQERKGHTGTLAAQITEERTQANSKHARLQGQKATRDDLENELREVDTRMLDSRREIIRVDHLVRRLTGTVTGESQEIAELKAQVARDERDINRRKRELEKARREYAALLERAETAIQASADAIVKAFDEYASQFLLETCELQYKMSRRTIGASGLLMAFPNFELHMSSATTTTSLRSSIEEVSESQKEFVDLAFRMALLEVSNGTDGGAMLVVETPEASLDSVFIDRAGRMLREFAYRTPVARRNALIATCNLNRENMIPALLGLKRDPQNKVIYKAAAAKCVVNLLQIAKPTKSYLKNKADYDRAFTESIGVQP